MPIENGRFGQKGWYTSKFISNPFDHPF